jgi:hypothetical protein
MPTRRRGLLLLLVSVRLFSCQAMALAPAVAVAPFPCAIAVEDHHLPHPQGRKRPQGVKAIIYRRSGECRARAQHGIRRVYPSEGVGRRCAAAVLRSELSSQEKRVECVALSPAGAPCPRTPEACSIFHLATMGAQAEDVHQPWKAWWRGPSSARE